MRFLALNICKNYDIYDDEAIIILEQSENSIGITVDMVDSVCAELQKQKKEIMNEERKKND